jgi:hypothetical protein
LSKRVYRKSLHKHWSSSIIQNDRPLETPLPIYPACSDLAIESQTKLNPLYEVTSSIRSIGFEHSSIRSKAYDVNALRKGVRFLLDYHLTSHADSEKADVLGEMFFNQGLFFSPRDTTNVSLKVSRSVTYTIFSAVALLRSIDSHVGSSNDNDSAVDRYADIERCSSLLNTKRGQGMLNKRWKICRV